jgi:hypothetical protein
MRLPKHVLRVWSEITALVAWWLRELHEIVEVLAAHVLPGWTKPLRVRVDGCNVVSFSDGSQLADDNEHSGMRAILLLSSSQVFTYEIALPWAVERQIDSAIELHLERELPLARAQACIDWTVVSRERSSRKLRVRIHVAHRAQVQRFVDLLTARGLRLVRVAVAKGAESFEGDLLPQRPRTRPLRFTQLDRRLVMVCLAFGSLACGVVAAQWLLERTRVNSDLALAEAQAQRARALARGLSQGALRSEALIGLMARPDAVDVLRALTDDIPSDTWLFELEVRASSVPGYHVKLSGYAPAATMFVDALKKSAKFDGVRLVSAASAGLGTAQDRLTVTARYAP